MKNKSFWFHFIFSAILLSAATHYAVTSESRASSLSLAVSGTIVAVLVVRRLWPSKENHAS